MYCAVYEGRFFVCTEDLGLSQIYFTCLLLMYAIFNFRPHGYNITFSRDAHMQVK